MNEDNMILKALKFATGKDRFRFNELVENIQPDETQLMQLIWLIHAGDLFSHTMRDFYSQVTREKKDVELWARAEDHFRYLEYQALQEARKSSSTAIGYAFKALVVSIISIAASIVLSIISLNADVNIPESLYASLHGSTQSIQDVYTKTSESEVKRIDSKLEPLSTSLTEISVNTAAIKAQLDTLTAPITSKANNGSAQE